MAKLFVSYSRKDSGAARKLIQAFKEIQQDVWVDWEDIPPAVDWMDQIFRAIEGSDAFIFLVSPDSVVSEVCNVEIGQAAKNNKRIIPVVVRDVDPKTTKVNPVIGELNWIFIRETDNFEEGLLRVKTAIELDLPWVEEHNRLQVRALEWEREKESSLLLRGRDLRDAQKMVEAAADKNPKPTLLQKTYIAHSLRDERRRLITWIATGVAVLIMAVLSIYALDQRDRALVSEKVARNQEKIAKAEAKNADENARRARDFQRIANNERNKALDEREKAIEQERIAKAQSSAAKAQIYQARPGELFTSTLLAIDSMLKSPSDEAEEILRKNISLLPIPVKQIPLNGKINALEFNTAGDAFVTASADGQICAWKVEGGNNLFCVTSRGSATDATFSSDGNLIVASDDTGLVHILDASTGDPKREPLDFKVSVLDVSIKPDNRSAAAARNDGLVSLFELPTGKESGFLQTSGSLVVSTFSPNGEWFAAGSSTGSVTLWSLSDSNRIISSSKHGNGEVLALSFSPNSRYLATGGRDNLAFVFEPDNKRQLLRIPNEDWVTDLAFSPDNKWFVTVSNDQRIRVWDIASGEERLRMLQDSAIQDVQVSANGQWIATTGADRSVRVWSVATGAEMFRIPLRGSGLVLGFDSEAKYLVAGDDSGEISIWDISVMPVPMDSVLFSGLISDAQYDLEGGLIFASDENCVWSLNPNALPALTRCPQDKPVLNLDNRRVKIDHFAVNPVSTQIAVSTTQKELILYNVNNRADIAMTMEIPITSLAFSSDGSQLLVGDTVGQLQTRDVNSGNVMDTILDNDSGILSIAVGPSLTAVGIKDRVLILDSNHDPAGEVEQPGENRVLAFSADGSLLASGNESDQLHIWKYGDGKYNLLQTIIKEPAFSLAFNAKGDILAVGGAQTVYLVNPLTGEEVNRIPHADAVISVSFSGDTNMLLTASANVLQVWDIDSLQKIAPDQLVQTACSRVVRNFDQTQWSFFFSGEPKTVFCEGKP